MRRFGDAPDRGVRCRNTDTSKDLRRLANDHAQRPPVRLLSSRSGEKQLVGPRCPSADQLVKKAPPRLNKPSRHGDVVAAPTAELEQHKAAFRDVFGQTLSDEFVDVMLTQLVSALRPGPFDVLEEATLNAASALIASVKPQGIHQWNTGQTASRQAGYRYGRAMHETQLKPFRCADETIFTSTCELNGPRLNRRPTECMRCSWGAGTRGGPKKND